MARQRSRVAEMPNGIETPRVVFVKVASFLKDMLE